MNGPTIISSAAKVFPNVPRVWSQEQVQAWQKIVHAVHAKGVLHLASALGYRALCRGGNISFDI
ncbi:NADH:flavin oxidoreductase/NADH oxidase, N-terminal [Penicillium camemberti]|uniref:NADH:flavin oxidoreductase/NADH oxidase, N-terminal n=1 Tax=Penicillium camemberti (strain FM 013) TaxID=1429867 RepID=A0A0G4P6R2_PENC3|nr:NADH:flavin oxidoreductase/NADH oxidase, N-terminal [Penicillium camemberti]